MRYLWLLLFITTSYAQEYSINYSLNKEITIAATNEQELLKRSFRLKVDLGINGDWHAFGHGTAFGVDLTAFGYDNTHYLLTAAHTILDDHDKIHNDLSIEIEKEWFPVKVIKFNKNLDICLLYCKKELPVFMLSHNEVVANDKVLLIGSPHNSPITVFTGIVKETYYNNSIKTYATIQFDRGDSGAPVIGTNNEVVGMAVCGVMKDGDIDKNVMLFVPLSIIASFMIESRR